MNEVGYMCVHIKKTISLEEMICSKFNSGGKGARGTERKQENGKGEGSDKDLRYSPDGRELHIYHPLCKCAVKLSYSTLKQENAEIKSSPSCSHPAGSTLYGCLLPTRDSLRFFPPALTMPRGFP